MRTDTNRLVTSRDSDANYMPITNCFFPFIFRFSSQGQPIYKVIYIFIKFGVKISSGKQVFN